MGFNMSCDSGQSSSLQDTEDGFHSPTLVCSDPKALIFPNQLSVKTTEFDSDDSSREYRWRGRRSRSPSLRQGRRSHSYHSSLGDYAEPQTDELQIQRTYGSLDLCVKVPGKTLHLPTPAAPRNNNPASNGDMYNKRNYQSGAPWAAPITPTGHVAVTYTPRSTESWRRRR